MRQLDADVVVIAAGASGLAAAVAAAQSGARVIAFEKAATTGGAANHAMGLFAAESRMQTIKQVGLTTDDAFKIFMDYTHWRGDAELVRAYINKSASTIDWLENMGVEFLDIGNHNPGLNYTWHIVKPPSGILAAGSASVMMKILTDTAQELGAKIFTRTPVKRIHKKEGKITGVLAEDSKEEEIQVNAKAVIIASGGFIDNPEWIKKYTVYQPGYDLFPHKIPGLVGDGIRMAWEVGAGATEILMHLISGGAFTVNGLAISFCQPHLIVNLEGKRFMNEEIIVRNLAFSANAIARQKSRTAFVIYDEDTRQYYEKTGMDFPFCGFPILQASNFDAELKQVLHQGDNNIFVTQSLVELATKTGINPDNLQNTVDEYNKICETGRDELYNKYTRYLRKVKQPKFYCYKLRPDAFGTLGGIRINSRTEVLSKEFDIIPGLYAAGNDANSIYGDTYIYPLPGNTLGFAINSGRIAGENAARFAASLR